MDILEDWGEPNPETSNQEVVNHLKIQLWHQLTLYHHLKSDDVGLLYLLSLKTNLLFLKVMHQLNALTCLVPIVLTHLLFFISWLAILEHIKLLQQVQGFHSKDTRVLDQVMLQCVCNLKMLWVLKAEGLFVVLFDE